MPHKYNRDDGLIFQRRPTRSKDSHFPAKGWTETIIGYWNEARWLSNAIIKNRKRTGEDYTWLITINIMADLSPEEIAHHWKVAADGLRKQGLVALWVREPSKSNRVHYHLMAKNKCLEKEIKAIIEAGMPRRKTVRYRKYVAQINNQVGYANYITKAKVQERLPDGTVINKDKYAPKRLLFKPNVGLRKYGTIGRFWGESSKARLVAEGKAKEKQIRAGLEDPLIEELTFAMEAVLGPAFRKRNTAYRTVGYFSKEYRSLARDMFGHGRNRKPLAPLWSAVKREWLSKREAFLERRNAQLWERFYERMA